MTTSVSSSERKLKRAEVRAWALEAGFAEAGVVALAHANEERDAARFEEWVGAGRAGTMEYLTRRTEDGRLVRSRVAVPFPWAQSVIVCWASYAVAGARSTDAAAEGTGWIARYAWTGRRDAKGELRASDYHKVLLRRVKALETRLRERLGEFEARAYVDTGPVVERQLGAAAGLGWVGKNTCLIHEKLGSFGFLAVLVTSLQVSESASQQVSESAGSGVASPGGVLEVPDRCGSCRRCLEACPTGALIEPYKMDARKCISYLTIEHRGAMDAELMGKMGRQVFGCDICQDVCPWNSPGRTPITADAEMETRAELENPALEWLAEMDEAEFERRFNGSPVRRAGFLGLRRNVAVAMGNSGGERYAERLREWADAADEGVKAAARWGIKKLTGKVPGS